jgi:hypothetical protein
MSKMINTENILLPENKWIAQNIFIREGRGDWPDLNRLSSKVRKVIGDLIILESTRHSPDILILLFYIGKSNLAQKGHKTFSCKGLNRQIRKFDPMLTIVPSAWRWNDGCREIGYFIQLPIHVSSCGMEREIREGIEQINRSIRSSGIGIPLYLSDTPLDLKICQCGHLLIGGWGNCIHCGDKRI